MGFGASPPSSGHENLTDFTGTISNYETDVFRPIRRDQKLSGNITVDAPRAGSGPRTRAGKARIAFRVIADIRTLSLQSPTAISRVARPCYVLRRTCAAPSATASR
jgi:hypothetical protein